MITKATYYVNKTRNQKDKMIVNPSGTLGIINKVFRLDKGTPEPFTAPFSHTRDLLPELRCSVMHGSPKKKSSTWLISWRHCFNLRLWFPDFPYLKQMNSMYIQMSVVQFLFVHYLYPNVSLTNIIAHGFYSCYVSVTNIHSKYKLLHP